MIVREVREAGVQPSASDCTSIEVARSTSDGTPIEAARSIHARVFDWLAWDHSGAPYCPP